MAVDYVPVMAMAGSIRTTCDARYDHDTVVVSIMHANNETGTLQPIRAYRRYLPRGGSAVSQRRIAERGKDADEVSTSSASTC